MNTRLKNYFSFTRTQRTGILSLFSIIVLVQIGYYVITQRISPEASQPDESWLALQKEIDSLKILKSESKRTIYPFNPNFITDFKGYTLGMSVAEIDRLLEFRKSNRYVNSAAEFQQVTKVSDSLLNAIAPYFKFPEWTQKGNSISFAQQRSAPKEVRIIDINQATQEDLIKVYGIGPAISERILKFKQSLGGFVSMAQMNDVWGLSPEVIEKLNEGFKVSTPPDIKKIAINDASIKELAAFPYFRYALAKQIVTYRSMNGDFKSAADLAKVNGLPPEKAEIIALYLEF